MGCRGRITAETAGAGQAERQDWPPNHPAKGNTDKGAMGSRCDHGPGHGEGCHDLDVTVAAEQHSILPWNLGRTPFCNADVGTSRCNGGDRP